MTSSITEDSGIHTMSSRRESAFSDSVLPHTYNLPDRPQKKANSDCAPMSGYLYNKCYINQADILRNPQDKRNCANSSCNGFDTISVFSQAPTHENQTRLSCHQDTATLSHCNHRCSSDPGIRNSFTYQQTRPTSGCYEILPSTCSYGSQNYCSIPNNDIHSHQLSPMNSAKLNRFSTVEVSEPPTWHTENHTSKHHTTHNLKKNSLQPLSSKRLLPTRHQTKNSILSILDTHEVCIEFVKKRGRIKKEVVFEVCRISPDGLRIALYEPEGGKGVPPSNSPPPLPLAGTDEIFSFENLPEKHWKKYMYASKFVNLVKAKTAKITYYTNKAKCQLMENLTDFEACFYEGNYKYFYLLIIIVYKKVTALNNNCIDNQFL